MKRTGLILILSLFIVLMQTASCFAGNLEIVKSYPHDGEGGRQPVNMAVKLYFNQNVSLKDEDSQKSNDACFQIVDEKNKPQPITVVYDQKEEGYVLVALQKDLAPDSEYRLKVSGNFTAASGDTLGDNQTITFRTRSTENDMTVNMVMMGVMFVGILFFSSRQMKRQMQKDAEEKEQKVNPYKVSKETGKSVEEIVEKTQKQKQKKEAEEAKRKAKLSGKKTNETEDLPENGNKRVKVPRPVSGGGSSYLSGRVAKAKEEEEKRAAEWAAGTTKPKNQRAKGKNKKK